MTGNDHFPRAQRSAPPSPPRSPLQESDGPAKVELDSRPLDAALAELEANFEVELSARRLGELRELVSQLSNLFTTHSYVRRAGRAGESVVVFEPSERLCCFLAALRAGDID